MISRRFVLRSALAGGACSGFLLTVPGLKALAETPVPIRRSLGAMDLDDPDIQTYREFVSMMRDPGRPVEANWVAFANIHGSVERGLNLCPHGDWYFLPWHRAYVQMYEQAARLLTGNTGFAMPYWDWTVDRQLPRAFSDEQWAGQPNPLFESSRTMSPNDSLPDDMVGQQQVIAQILAETEYSAFGTSKNPDQNNTDQHWINGGGGLQGLLEANPHNRVHCRVGGIMCTGGSPQDPIFMMHHCNIDRLWHVWNAAGGNNSTDPLWTDMVIENNFIGQNGDPYSVVVKNLQYIEALGYSYGPTQVSEIPVKGEGKAKEIEDLLGAYNWTDQKAGIDYVTNEAAASALVPLQVGLRVSRDQLVNALGGSEKEVMTPLAVGSPIAASPKQILVAIRDVPPPEQNNAEYRVFINCDYLSQEVPTTDPHYVTTIGFFGNHNEHAATQSAHSPPSFLVNLTGSVQRLARLKRLVDDKINIQILASPRSGINPKEVYEITPKTIELAII